MVSTMAYIIINYVFRELHISSVRWLHLLLYSYIVRSMIHLLSILNNRLFNYTVSLSFRWYSHLLLLITVTFLSWMISGMCTFSSFLRQLKMSLLLLLWLLLLLLLMNNLLWLIMLQLLLLIQGLLASMWLRPYISILIKWFVDVFKSLKILSFLLFFIWGLTLNDLNYIFDILKSLILHSTKKRFNTFI